ncbi:hypothetical protein BC830DRAFT_586610 [Chytriomyces sp. MP71]|nr:hypothetical protein BC830DRAFT_586610 [Chytriomyces sp. MP71]
MEAMTQATSNLQSAHAEIERLQTELSLALQAQAAHKASFDAEVASLRGEKESLESQLIATQEKLSQHLATFADQVEKGTAGASQFQETIALLNSQKAAIEQETSSLRDSVAELQSKLSEVSTQLELKVSDHAEVERELESSRSAASSLESALKEATDKLGSVSSGSDSLDTELNALKATLKDKDIQCSNLESQIIDLERIKSNSVAAEAEVSRLTILLAEAEKTLSAKLEGSESEVARVQEQSAAQGTPNVDSSVEQMKTLQAQVDALKARSADIKSTQSALETANMEVASLKQQLAASSISIDELNKVKSDLVSAESELGRLRSELGSAPATSHATDEILSLKAELEAATLSVKELEELKSKLIVSESESSRLQAQLTELRTSLLDDFENRQLNIKSSLNQALQEKDDLAKELAEIKKKLESTNNQSGPESPASSSNGSPQPPPQAEKRGSSSDISLPLSPNSAGSPKSLIGRLWGAK